MEQQTKIGGRITVIDALRGFALLGVVLVHMQQHYSIFNFGMFAPTEPLFPELDSFIGDFTRNVLMGRFINIFAFLFGLSFFIQMDRASAKGIDFRRRFVWRMVILFVIGVIGSAFYSGDILSIYAVFGLILVLLYPLKNKVLMLIACLILLGAPRWISVGYDKLTAPAVEMVNESAPQGASQAPRAPQRQFNFSEPKAPSFVDSVKSNLTEGRSRTLDYQFGLGGRGYLTFAMFILGLVVGRIRFFETVHLHRRRNLLLFVGFAVATWLVGKLSDLFPQEQPMFFMQGTPSNVMLVRLALNDIGMVLFSAAITMGFVVLYHVRGIGRCLNVMSPYGRMGLTNYEMQGIVGSILFSLWGLGEIFSPLHATELFAFGVAVYVVQIIISKLWLKYFKYGPLEWLWRSATYLKHQPFRK